MTSCACFLVPTNRMVSPRDVVSTTAWNAWRNSLTVCCRSMMWMPLRAPKMYCFIFGFHRPVLCPKCTPASSSARMLMGFCPVASAIVSICQSFPLLPPAPSSSPETPRGHGRKLSDAVCVVLGEPEEWADLPRVPRGRQGRVLCCDSGHLALVEGHGNENAETNKEQGTRNCEPVLRSLFLVPCSLFSSPFSFPRSPRASPHPARVRGARRESPAPAPRGPAR